MNDTTTKQQQSVLCILLYHFRHSPNKCHKGSAFGGGMWCSRIEVSDPATLPNNHHHGKRCDLLNAGIRGRGKLQLSLGPFCDGLEATMHRASWDKCFDTAVSRCTHATAPMKEPR